MIKGGRVSIFLLLIAVFVQCTDKNGRMPASLLPLSVAAPGEIFISMDSLQWRGPVGEKIRSILSAEIEGLPREETLFTLRYIEPKNMSSTLRQVSNIIYVTTFDINRSGARTIQAYFPEESKEKILSSPDYFLTTSQDVYAREQEIMYLFGQTEASLINNLNNHGQRITDHFNRIERKRIEGELFSSQEQGITTSVGQNFDLTFKLPKGFQMALLKDDFAWMVWQENKVDKHVIVTYTDYYDLKQFENDSIIKRRDYISKKYIYEDRENLPNSHMLTETEIPFIPVKSRQINLNDHFAVETRGLWRTNTRSMGGPFIGISIVDESRNRLYYIEGFIYSPGESQREYIREMEAILHSFKFNP